MNRELPSTDGLDVVHQNAVDDEDDRESNGAAEDGERVEVTAEAGSADGVVRKEGERLSAAGAGLRKVGGDEVIGA